MTFHNAHLQERFLNHGTAILEEYDVALECGTDFEHYRAILSEARPDHVLGAPFDPNICHLNAENAFWLIGRDSADRIVHTQAVKMLESREKRLADYMRNHFREFPPSGVDIDLSRSRYRAGPGAKRMKGSIAYHGEFWIGGASGEFRGTGMSCILSRIGFCEAMLRWSPDHIVAFMAKAVAFKGLAERTGWMHTEPGALQWYLRGNDTPIEGFIAYLSREDLFYLLETSLTDAISQAA